MNKTILIAPLNWGLGHATRCIPIIKALQEQGFTPIIASDGAALELLQKEFPNLKTLQLPSYSVKYSKRAKNFKWKIIQQLPKFYRAIQLEKEIVEKWVKIYNIQGIISDNRLGVFHKKIPSVFITHQLRLLTGSTSWISSKLHLFFVAKYTECWIPDFDCKPNLAGKLGYLKKTVVPQKHIGPLSRFEKTKTNKKYDLAIILSGPEPQRSLLETKITNEIKHFEGKIVFVRGTIQNDQKKQKTNNITYFNYLKTKKLNKILNQSNLILCRSGYTSIMDLAKLEKKAFFIPTPGQYEQEYLAKKLQQENIAPFANQANFVIKDLSKTVTFTGFLGMKNNPNWEDLFRVFKKSKA